MTFCDTIIFLLYVKHAIVLRSCVALRLISLKCLQEFLSPCPIRFVAEAFLTFVPLDDHVPFPGLKVRQ